MNHNDQIKELRDMPFGKEFQAYLISLAAATTGKPKPPPAFIRNLERENSTFITANDIRHVMTEMQALFDEEGYMPRQQLENRLMQRLCPDLTANDLAQADAIISGEYTPDHLTGFLQKPLVPLATAEAWFYTKSTGRPSYMLEIDFSNMRGTNEHYEQLLQEQSGAAKTAHEISEQAMALTDKAARRLCDKIIATLEKNTKGEDGVHYTALRTGGDEARIILSDLDEQRLPALIDGLHDAIEEEIRALGLQHHPHAKAPDDPLRNGFGAAMTAIPLAHMDNMTEAIKNADEEIKAAKYRIGRQRLSETPAAAAQDDALKNKIKQDFSQGHKISAPSSGISSVFGEQVPDKVLSLDQIRKAAFSHLHTQLEKDGKTLTPRASRLLETKIARYPAVDYASGTLMPRDQPVIASIFRDILARQQDLPERDDPPVLYGLGVSLHNLSGLNEALGHDAANACLHYTAHNIIIPALHKQGIPDSHFTLAHYGGGEFRAVIKDPRHVTGHELSAAAMTKITEDIRQRTADFNQNDTAGFLARYGITLDNKDGISLPAQHKDIPHGKPDQRPWNNGLSVTAISRRLPVFEKGSHNIVRAGAMLHDIGRHLELEANANLALKRTGKNNARPTLRDPPSGGGNSR